MRQIGVLCLLVLIMMVGLKIQSVDARQEIFEKIRHTRFHELPGLLYPRESESREVKSLDGLWDFAVPSSNNSKQFPNRYQKKLSETVNVMKMPVPSSYNDITTSKEIRDHVGSVWYEREFFISSLWKDKLIFIRFGSVNYYARVWLNGEFITEHKIGHLPFEAEINSKLNFGGSNRITVEVNNILTYDTVPQGKVSEVSSDNGTVRIQSYTFDFFNYAGIHRPVLLHTKPRVHISDMTIVTTLLWSRKAKNAKVLYDIRVAGLQANEVVNCTIALLNSNSSVVSTASSHNLWGGMIVSNATLWYPQGMSDTPGYLYTLQVILSVNGSTELDIYRLPIGIREIKWTNTNLLLNRRPIYLRGFGRHEDSILRGRGLDLVTMTRDHELLKWLGANSYRTSHYPYSDEVMDMADSQGFLIIDECPSVDMKNPSFDGANAHDQSIQEMIRRDKNRPSVIMWSIANEPRGNTKYSGSVLRHRARRARSLDPTRPITASLNDWYNQDEVAQYLDVISFNRYNSWYSNPGRLDMIVNEVINEATNWYNKHNKLVLMSEYGADTVTGMHELPDYIWSEEYQTGVLSKHFEAFDELRARGWFIGEFIWNFADFRTAQSITRVGGNKKGIFTRTRQPKMAAHHVRKRYHAIATRGNKAKLPEDLTYYVFNSEAHDEL